MACRQIGALPLSESAPEYCWLDSKEQIAVKFLIEIGIWSLHTMHSKMSSAKKSRAFCLGPNVLMQHKASVAFVIASQHCYDIDSARPSSLKTIHR